MAILQARVWQRKAAEHDAWFRRKVQAGLDSANAGRLIPAVEVEARFAEKRAATRRQLKARLIALLVEVPDQVAALDVALHGILPAFGIKLGCAAQIDLFVRVPLSDNANSAEMFALFFVFDE